MNLNSIQEVINCPIHRDFEIEYMRVNDIEKNSQKGLFYCSTCIDRDGLFQMKNFVSIKNIINQGLEEIIPKWPPIHNNLILESLQNKLRDQKNQVITFFDSLTKEMIKRIDECKKKILKQIKDDDNNSNILQYYQNISRINELGQILSNKHLSNNQRITFCKEIILEMQAQKEQNQKQFELMLQNSQQRKNNINLEFLNSIKQSVFSLVDSIDFQSVNLNLISFQHDIKCNQKVSSIMKLVENFQMIQSEQGKSSFRNLLNIISPVIERICDKDDFILNKKFINIDVAEFNLNFELSPNKERILVKLSKIYNKLGLYVNAIEYSQKAIEINPQFYQAYTTLGFIFYNMDKLEESIYYLQTSLKMQPNYGKSHYYLGISYLKICEYDTAKNYLNLAIESIVTHDNSFRFLENIFQNKQQTNNSKNNKASLNLFLKSKIKDDKSCFFLGITFLTNQLYQEALLCFQQAVEQDCLNYIYNYWLGYTYQALSQSQNAICYLMNALKLNPKDLDSFLLLKRISQELFQRELSNSQNNEMILIEEDNFGSNIIETNDTLQNLSIDQNMMNKIQSSSQEII